MRIVNLAIAVGMLGALPAGIASAQTPAYTGGLRQPTSMQSAPYADGDYISFAPNNGASESPSDAPPAATAQAPATTPQAAAQPEEAKSDNCDQKWTLPQPCLLKNRGITLGGWTEVGTTLNNHDPVPDYNGVVTFPDKAGQFLLDQQWFFLDKPIKNDGCGWGWGGHVDVMYGSDAIFTQAYGLENPGHQEDFYQVALPQFYLDIAYNDLTMRVGHFYTILGYEVVAAPQNFFYTHAYTFQYGEPFTHTGMLFMYKANDSLSFSAGLQRGDDQWEARPGVDHVGFLGGVKWTGPNKKLELAFSLSTSEIIAPEAYQQIYSLVATYHFTDKFKYVFQHDLGQVANGYVVDNPKATWYGINQYFLYDINKCWAAGLRAEWFRDDSGVRVTGLRPENPDFGHSFPGNFFEMSLGVNWKPNPNFVARPEVRWDWYDAAGNVAFLPFDNGNRASQFLVGCDFILTY